MTTPPPAGRVVAVVPAAGSGTRLGAGIPKAFVEVDGRTLLERCVEGLLRSGVVDEVVATVPAGRTEQAEALLADARARTGRGVVHVTVGGAERTDSVRAGLEVVARPDGRAIDVVLVHDAARCRTPADVVARVVEAVRSGLPAVVPVLPLADTVKTVDSGGVVTGTPDRATLRAVQTPQGFDPGVLLAAYAAAGDAATDDAGLVERAGGRVHTVAGDPAAAKITTPADLALAEYLLARTPPPQIQPPPAGRPPTTEHPEEPR